MGGFEGDGKGCLCLRWLWLSAARVLLANCANSNTVSRANPNSIVISTSTDPGQEQNRLIRDADRSVIQRVADVSNGRPIVVGGRSHECPLSFCGCEASLYVFGEVRPNLNLVSNWMREFPRASPAPGMAAVRNHHVFVLMGHVSGNDWLVHDGNSGHGLIREHVRSISGYTIVNPKANDAAAPQLALAQ